MSGYREIGPCYTCRAHWGEFQNCGCGYPVNVPRHFMRCSRDEPEIICEYYQDKDVPRETPIRIFI